MDRLSPGDRGDVFINGEPLVTEPLLPLDDDEPNASSNSLPDRSEQDEFLKNSPHAHPMAPEDHLPEGEIAVIFGKHIRPEKRRS